MSVLAITCPLPVRVAVPVASPSVPVRPAVPSAKNVPAESVSLSPVRLPPGLANEGPVTAAFHVSRMCSRFRALPSSASTDAPTSSPLSQTSPGVR
ncbi:hypothetical protein ACFQX6_52185 [Streptosporangium lutulentum]